MKSTKRCDVFISYRREGAFETADAINQRLINAGYSVFFDLEMLAAGKFNIKILDHIEHCTDFIIVLPKEGLDRCVNEDDWVRLEIEHAIKHGKNIIPITLRGFEWPDNLPESLKDLANYNGITATNHNVFPENIDRLKNRFLHSKPGFTWAKERRLFFSIATIIGVIVTILATIWLNRQKEYYSLCKGISSAMGGEIFLIDGVLNNLNTVDKGWEKHIKSLEKIDNLADTINPYNNFAQKLKYYSSQEQLLPKKKILTDHERKILRTNGIEIEDIEGYFNIVIPAFYDALKHHYDMLLTSMSPQQYYLNKEITEHFVDLHSQFARLWAESVYVYYLGVMSTMPRDAVEHIIGQVTIKLRNLPLIDDDKSMKYYEDRSEQLGDKMNELSIRTEGLLFREQEVVNRLENIVENMKEKKQIQEKLGGIEEKNRDIAKLRVDVAQAEEKFAEIYERALNKFAIEEQDDQWYKWGKIIRISNMANNSLIIRKQVEADYLQNISIAKKQNIDTALITKPTYIYSLNEMFNNVEKWLNDYQKYHPKDTLYISQAKKFYWAVGNGYIPYSGVIVFGTKDNIPHPTIQTGDILVERKGEVIRNVEHYISLKDKLGEDELKILRFKYDGKVQYVTSIIPSDCKVLIGITDLTSNE